MMWREREVEDLKVRVSHLLGSCHQTSMCSPLLLLVRGPSSPLTFFVFMLHLFSSMERTAFWVCQSVLSEGDWKKNLANPICLSLLICGTQELATSVSKLSYDRNLKSQQAGTKWVKWVQNGRGINGLTPNIVLCPLLKLSLDKTRWQGGLSNHTVLMSTYKGKKVHVNDYFRSVWMNEIIHWG